MKKILPQLLHLMLISFIISITQSAKAQISTDYTNETDEQYSFVVWTNSGETFNYLLSERPKVTQTTSSLVLTTTKTEVEYAKDDVWKFTIQKTPDIETSIASIFNDNYLISRQNNIVYLSNFRPNIMVYVYSISGILLSSQKTSEVGTLTIDFSNLSHGVYIISTESITYKIIKR